MHPMKSHLHWLTMIVAAGLVGAVFAFVDLQPHIDQGFFFAADNPAFREAERIKELFPADEQLIIAAGSSDIHNDQYFKRIHNLTERLEVIAGINAVKSITQGPDDLDDAIDSPLWRLSLIHI